MDLGLYQMKHPFAKLIRWLIPMCANVDPNVLSWLLVPIGLVIATTYYFAPEYPALYLLGILLIFFRLVVATLDGLVAIAYQKASPQGEMVNRIAPEIADWMMLGAILWSRSQYVSFAIPVLLIAWASSFFCLIGLVAKRPVQSVGPCGQTDRLAALIMFSLAAFIGSKLGSDIDFMRLFLLWTLVGGSLTILLRGYRSLRAQG